MPGMPGLRDPRDPRPVVIVAYPDVGSLDVTGPAEVFAAANSYVPRPAYAVSVVSRAGGTIRSSSGVGLATAPLGDGPVDTLMVAGGDGTTEAVADRVLVDWVRSAAGRSRRVT